MSLQGPIVVVAEKPAEGLVQAFTVAGAFPVVEARWTDAPGAVASIKPSAVVLAEPQAPDAATVQALEAQIAASEAYMPVVARTREDDATPFANALPVAEDADVERLVARLTSALRLRALHATVIGRARTLLSERNIIAELPPGDPIEDATVLVVGRGRMHPTLSVAVGERMGVIGAMSVDLAARCLNVRDIDGIVIGDGLSPKMVVALLVVLAEDTRFRDLPVAMLGPEERVDELPNMVHARDPHLLIERLIPMVRQRAFEQRLKRLLKSIESKGMIDPRTGLLTPRCVRPRSRPRHRRCRRARRRPLGRAVLVRGGARSSHQHGRRAAGRPAAAQHGLRLPAGRRLDRRGVQRRRPEVRPCGGAPARQRDQAHTVRAGSQEWARVRPT